MKKKQISLKWKIARYLIIFSVLVISVVFLFQVVLLEPMYEANKAKGVREVADSVAEGLRTDNFDQFIDIMQNQSDTCIMVYQDSSYASASNSDSDRGCILYSMSDEQRASYIANANSSKDGTYMAKVRMQSFADTPSGKLKKNDDDEFHSIIYTRIVRTGGNDAVVMVSANVTPLNSTIRTLSGQMVWIGIFLIISILILTYTLYREIARPLTEINEAAKDLPKGEYHENPKTNRYREASELNTTLSNAAKDIHKADKAKRDLISNVSHDLRTPLTMITGYGEMMMDLPEEKTDENLQVIVDESKRLNNLVNDLLDLSRLEENRIVLHQEDFDLTELVNQQLRKYDVYRMKEGFQIEEFLTGPQMVYADHKRIEQVFNNFMTNAINYGGNAKHVIVREIEKKDTVRIEVQDFGEGIAKEDLPNIWDRYYKVDKKHVRVSNGSGIGLAIVKQVLDLHKAPYGVESEKGKGSTFWFELPKSRKSDEKSA